MKLTKQQQEREQTAKFRFFVYTAANEKYPYSLMDRNMDPQSIAKFKNKEDAELSLNAIRHRCTSWRKLMRSESIDLTILNSLTKYPSIPTFHALDQNGVLTPEFIDFGTEKLYASEKIDGLNSRIILMPDGRYIIGSREDLLYGNGDLIHNPVLGIVDAMKPVAERLRADYWLPTIERLYGSGGAVEPSKRYDSIFPSSCPFIRVYYFEMYGGRTPESKQYTGSSKNTACRLLDLCDVEVERLSMPLETISGWRERGGQRYFDHDGLVRVAGKLELKLTPRIEIQSIPTNIDETYAWMRNVIPSSLVMIDAEAKGVPEGLVVRNQSRTKIVKIRFKNYERYFQCRDNKRSKQGA